MDDWDLFSHDELLGFKDEIEREWLLLRNKSL